jgi:hypothetical protein
MNYRDHERDDYQDRGNSARRIQRVPFTVIFDRFLILILAILLLGLAIYLRLI